MPVVKRAKTTFAAGELAPELLGRGDLSAFDNGARRLRNVFIQPTGGLTRRAGLRHVAALPGAARIIPFEFNTEQTYLVVLVHGGNVQGADVAKTSRPRCDLTVKNGQGTQPAMPSIGWHYATNAAPVHTTGAIRWSQSMGWSQRWLTSGRSH